jgi:hypothetical protein
MTIPPDPAAEPIPPSGPPIDIDVSPPDPPSVRGPISFPITIPERREIARAWIAKVLVGIFGFEVLGAILAVWFCSEKQQELKDILTLILGPTVAVIGSVLGFYFGAENGDRSSPSQPPTQPSSQAPAQAPPAQR